MSSLMFRPLLIKYASTLRSSIFTLKPGYENGGLVGSDLKQDETGVRSYTTMIEKEKMCKQFLGRAPPKYKPCTHVIFDLDGTLLNTEDISYDASYKYVERVFKKKLTMELYGSIMGSLSNEGANMIVKELGLPISADVYLHGIWQDLRGGLLESEQLPGVDYLVCHFERCKVPMGLASSSTKQTFNLKTKNHKKLFSKFCPIVLGGSEAKITRGKPHPDIFLLAANRFPDEPERADQVLVFEDSLNGVRAAKAAGMQVVMIPNPCLPRHLIELAEPTILLNSLQQFDPRIFELPGYPGTKKKEF